MKNLKRICNRILFPPGWLSVPLTIVGAAALAAVFLKGLEETPLAYAAYVVAFYAFTVLCAACILRFPGYYKAVKKKINATALGNRYLTDPAFKTHISLYRSFAINILYAAFNLFSGLYYGTAWFLLFAGYYTIMAVMRFLLLRYVNQNGFGKNRFKELQRARLCAFILLSVNLALSGAVLMMVYLERGFTYYGILIYVMAMYTFYITTAAIINMIKYKKYNSPVMSMAKSISLAAALISMLALETAMLAQFGSDMAPENQRILLIATGAGISIIIACISVYTIRKSGKEIKALKRNRSLKECTQFKNI